jgi:hypothetical protein
MNYQLSYDLLTDASKNPSIHFRSAVEVSAVAAELQAEGGAIYSIDGSQINSRQDLCRLLAAALQRSEPWYVNEEFEANINSFVDILDSVADSMAVKARVVVLHNATQFWQNHTAIAGDLVEWWQAANIRCDSNFHLIFVV